MANSTAAGKSSARGQQQRTNPESRPAKRRRVEEPARPPVKLSVTQPRGPLRRTVNGVRTGLAVGEHGIDGRGRIAPALQQDIATADATPAGEQKRVLRSQGGGPRLTSDLVHFFPDYEESIFGEAASSDILHPNSSLYITDDNKDKGNSTTLPIRNAPSSKARSHTASRADGNVSPDRPWPVSSATKNDDAATNNGEVLDLSAYEKEALEFRGDPLPDSEYLKAHRRGERNEKQMRNVEKERAMHEKWELERLYDELRGPDWLKTMGITGITDTEKKKFESKRDHFVGRVKALLGKFEKWKENEKELRMKKERATAAKAEERAGNEAEKEATGEEQNIKEENGDGSTPEGDDLGDQLEEGSAILDAAALQLQQEAQSADQSLAKPKLKAYDPTLEQWDSAKPFTSFYTKPHERAAAVGKFRRGRHVTAFGHQLPYMAEEDFELPEGFLTWEEMRDNARKRRRQKRESLAKDEI